MKYMLDTNILIYAGKNKPQQVLDRLLMCTHDEACISSITLAELEYGVSKSKNKSKNRMALLQILAGITVVPFDGEAALCYGEIRADLEKEGRPIGANDMLIAAHALSKGLILVTNNEKEFKRVNGLETENWVRLK